MSDDPASDFDLTIHRVDGDARALAPICFGALAGQLGNDGDLAGFFGHAYKKSPRALNLAVVRHMAFNILKRDKSKLSLKRNA